MPKDEIYKIYKDFTKEQKSFTYIIVESEEAMRLIDLVSQNFKYQKRQPKSDCK